MFSIDLVQRLLDTTPVARLAQTDPDGGPQALPFVFARVGQSLWSPVDGKPKKSGRLRRLEWIAADPRVLVLLDHYEDDWSQLWWLKVSGRAAVVDERQPDWPRAIRGLARKYPQYAQTPMFTGEPTMVRIEILHWKSWAYSGESELRQQYFCAGADANNRVC